MLEGKFFAQKTGPQEVTKGRVLARLGVDPATGDVLYLIGYFNQPFEAVATLGELKGARFFSEAGVMFAWLESQGLSTGAGEESGDAA